MHPTETHHRFIELRAQGLSLARIADELEVAKSTLLAWERKFHGQIADLKNVELEALQEKVLASHEVELSQLAGHLNRVETVLAKRNFEYVSTEFLFYMAGALRTQIRKHRVVPDFSPAPDGGQPGTHPQPSTLNPQSTDGQS